MKQSKILVNVMFISPRKRHVGLLCKLRHVETHPVDLIVIKSTTDDD